MDVKPMFRFLLWIRNNESDSDASNLDISKMDTSIPDVDVPGIRVDEVS